jgi:cytidylate kinase
MIRVRNEFQLDDHPEAGEMPRVVLTLAARGQVILVGRGAGYYLPRDTGLHIRVVAPLEERVSHLADWLRLTKEAAAIEVTNRDDARASFLLKHFGKREVDLYDFDLVINSGLLNEETCADTITAIIMGKQDQIYPE